jgi:hypothetical protein
MRYLFIIALIACNQTKAEPEPTRAPPPRVNLREQMAEGYERQYNMAQGQADRCYAATLTAEAWLQAENKEKYTTWVNIRNQICE